LSDTLRFDEHIKYVLTICGQRLYLFKTLRGQGLSRCYINTVFQSLIISRLAYAIPAWGGFLLQHEINKIDSFLAKAFRFGFTLKQIMLSNILFEADEILYNCVQNPKHCIHGVLPPEKKLQTVLRKCHCFQLPNCHYKMFKDSFINGVVLKMLINK